MSDLTTNEVADILKVSRRHAYNMATKCKNCGLSVITMKKDLRCKCDNPETFIKSYNIGIKTKCEIRVTPEALNEFKEEYKI